jgi:hypothetical protein
MHLPRIISFDIGIKNMAYCVFEIYDSSSQPFQIIDWNVLNLMEKEEPVVFCNCNAIKTPPKKQKKVVVLENFFLDSSSNTVMNSIKLCGKIAKYQKNGIFYCEKHSKTQTQYIIPKKNLSISQLKKKKIEELLKICQEYKILQEKRENETKQTKKSILENLEIILKDRCLETLVESKKISAGDTDLIIIGKNMKTLLNLVKEIELVTHVIIENQISPIANRMKTVQGMLAQYFIMKNTDIKIDFVSSINKLKAFSKKENGEKEENESEKQKYSQHKKEGVFFTNQILEKNEWLSRWKKCISESKKKDDLADCFLQGIWFLNSKMNKILNI